MTSEAVQGIRITAGEVGSRANPGKGHAENSAQIKLPSSRFMSSK